MDVLLLALTYLLLLGFIAMLLSRLSYSKNRNNENLETGDALLGPEDMEKHAVELARQHLTGGMGNSSFLIKRVRNNFEAVSEAYGKLTNDVESAFGIPPAGEWLLDNFYIIEEHVREIELSLPGKYIHHLPVLSNSRMRELPRIYAISVEMVSHNDGMLDEKTIIRFLNAYQTYTNLTLGELWAVPVMLRVAVLGNIRSISQGMLETSTNWHKAEQTVEILSSLLESDQPELIKTAERLIKSADLAAPAYVEYLLQKLRRFGKKASSVINYIEARLAEIGSTLEKVTAFQHQLMASQQVTMGNLITSLRFVSAMDWSGIFEELSQVEKILKHDPDGIYSKMDFESREYYRRSVEKLAYEKRVSETLVAQRAIECAAEQKHEDKCGPPAAHVGYYLTGRGRYKLEERIRPSGSADSPVKRSPLRKKTSLYTGSIIAVTILISAIAAIYSYSIGTSVVSAVLAFIALLIPSSDITVMSVNFIICRMVTPSILPKYELQNGIPAEYATIVIVPTLLTNENRVNELIGQLEVYYLANREKNLYFALVGDFKDSAVRDCESDEAIITAGLEGVRRLNRKYPSDLKDIFYFFLRERQFNSVQSKWMGWERKRGAIMELNELLRGSDMTGFTVLSSEISELPCVKYVITLDADTILPMGTAKRLIGTISHPLNRAIIDENRGIVTEGYGLLQPRIGVSITSANYSLFSRVFAGQGGLDPYAGAVSDVYQDLFGEGIFTGKGIYELDVFRRVLRDAIPENTILSHDLLEGCHARTGLVTDIELVDGYPSRYASFAARLHRWVRGDWQLLPWLFGSIRNNRGERIKNPLSFISKWKIADNLRRSLVYPSYLLLLVLGFTVLPGSRLVWLLITLFAVGFNLIIDLLGFLLSSRYNRHIMYKKGRSRMSGSRIGIYQFLLRLSFIPYQACLMLDAVFRTLARVLLTRRNMLQWVTAADMEKLLKNDINSSWSKMWPSAAAGAVLVILAFLSDGDWYYSIPIAIIWAYAPELALKSGRKLEKSILKPGDADLRLLRRVARKTWRYFEDMSTARDNYLPPDNFQEDPPNGIAHRTSPSNIGLGLSAIVTARDLGYLCISEMVKRLELTINTVEKLEKWQGHLYNWYDTINLSILRPAYVSTVDSGNLVGYMMVVRTALESAGAEKIVNLSEALGIRDTIELFNEEVSSQGLILDTRMIDSFLLSGTANPVEWWNLLNNLWEQMTSDELRLKRIKKTIWGPCLLSSVSNKKTELRSLMPFSIDAGDIMELSSPGLDFIFRKCTGNSSLNELEASYEDLVEVLKAIEKGEMQGDTAEDIREKSRALMEKAHIATASVRDLKGRISSLIDRLTLLIDSTSFKPLYDPKRQLFSIGFNADEGSLSKSYYDLLASEARQASYIAVARGEVESRHWFRLGRRMTLVDDRIGLVSWTGTMFEYFMPMLVMKNYEGTLLDETYWFVLYSQQRYGVIRSIPWGTSESAFFAFDRSLNYQYKAFGVPELGLKRGLGNDMVVAPYASIMAVTFDPKGVAGNLRRLISEGMEGRYGFYEALDYTPSRMTRDKKSGVVKNYMVHHLGMSLLALNNFFNAGIMQTRFHSDPVIRCAELFLQERIPSRSLIAQNRTEHFLPSKSRFQEDGRVIRKFGLPNTELPKLHVLSNGNYSVLLTNGGSGYSSANGMAITRWHGDPRDTGNGFYIFVQNVNSNNVWSATYDPVGDVPEDYRVVFAPDRAEFARRDGNIETRTQIIVSTEDNAEIRRVLLTNRSQHPRVLEITSYLEAVIAKAEADLAHPAFSKLFVTTEFLQDYDCLLASRRPREKDHKKVWAVHLMLADGEIVGDIQYETDRMKFIGRNNTLANPHAMEADQPLTNSVGPVLDPIMSLRRRIKLMPGQSAQIFYILGMVESRENAIELAEKYRDSKVYERAFELARTRSLIESRYLDLKATQVELFLDMLPLIMFPGSLRRAWLAGSTSATKGQPGLWPFGISGDVPIVLLIVGDKEEIDAVSLMLKCHEFWKMKGIAFDLVMLAEDKGGYMQPLIDAVKDAVAASPARDNSGGAGGVFVINSAQLSDAERILLKTAARIILAAAAGPLNEQIVSFSINNPVLRFDSDKNGRRAEASKSTVCQCFDSGKLLYFNGIGGFSSDGSEYVINLREGMNTPTPWVNVIANEVFGFLITESGGGYTWSENSRENKLTPWSNDPVMDRPGEIVYLRDEATGYFWSLTPSPIRERDDYTISHGFGYTSFFHESHELAQEMTVFLPPEGSAKLFLISLANRSSKARRVSLVFYTRPVMGVNEKTTSQYLMTSQHSDTGAILVRNLFTQEFAGKIMFVDSSEREKYITGNRLEFIGINGSLQNPEAMSKAILSGTIGAGQDPCAAMQVFVEMAADEKRELVFVLGAADDLEVAAGEIKRLANPQTAKLELEAVKELWKKRLGTIKIKTPDASTDIMLNGWLMYQVLSCRLWARSGFYQSGGAFGFRDQLQDVMALAASNPSVTRSQILLHASRQFAEGDVQHWWHQEAGKGIRTRYSDDLLWLPYVTADYIENTGDFELLQEEVSYLASPPLNEGEAERYDTPSAAGFKESLYKHCIRAIDRALSFGEHGLPLMGSGDWNDGMNIVGIEGKGESVWLGWFIISVLEGFIPLCMRMGDTDKAEGYKEAAGRLISNIELNAWDGSWYRRAYFDDGTPLGSTVNNECKIDSIAQSWSVISGAAKISRARESMTAVENYLVDRDENLIKLLTPPFDEGDLVPGYIKGYVPGVRENGGQYTHAAVWVVLAFARLGMGGKALELYHMLNPVNHSRTPLEAARYKVEPYVMAADVYAVHPNIGRGGWTWYTGAAGWMYRVGIESILGIRKRGDKLRIEPCIPSEWSSYSVYYSYGTAVYEIHIKNPYGLEKGASKMTIDGAEVENGAILLVDDGGNHQVEVVMTPLLNEPEGDH